MSGHPSHRSMLSIDDTERSMVEIKRILCPIDFSDYSRHALAHAIVLARWYGATLTVFHAYASPAEPPPPGASYGGFAGMGPIDTLPWAVSPAEVREDAVAELTRFCQSMASHGVDLRFEAQPGSEVPSILDQAALLHADLLVLGTHGRGGLGRLVMGSVAEQVLRKASCAVLTVPPSVTAPPGDPLIMIKRILCPVDLEEASSRALAYGLSLAKEADAELVMLHVVDHTRGYLRLSEHDAVAKINAMMPPDAREWCRPDVLIAAGTPFEEILRTASERDIHMIVMGVHPRHPIDQMIFGSTTHQVVRAAPCPVLTLNEQERKPS